MSLLGRPYLTRCRVRRRIAAVEASPPRRGLSGPGELYPMRSIELAVSSHSARHDRPLASLISAKDQHRYVAQPQQAGRRDSNQPLEQPRVAEVPHHQQRWCLA